LVFLGFAEGLAAAGNTDALHFSGPPQAPVPQSAIHIVRTCVAKRLVGIELLLDRPAVIFVTGVQATDANPVNCAILF
jgi:hypothetical protein